MNGVRVAMNGDFWMLEQKGMRLLWHGK